MARKDSGPDHGGAPPTYEGWGTPVPGTRPIAGATQPGPPDGSQYGRPPATAQPGRARPWLILLVSFGVQLVVVLAVGNTATVRAGLRFRGRFDGVFGGLGTLPGVYSWRLTPPARDDFNIYPAALFALLTFFVVAALLTLALVRGPITFWRAFVAVWLSVIVATLIGGMVRRGVSDIYRFNGGGGRAYSALYGGGGLEVVAGMLTGLLAAIVAAIIAVVSRRPAQAVLPYDAPVPAPYTEPAAPPPWHGDDDRTGRQYQPPQAPQQAPSFQKSQSDDTQATTRFAAVPSTVPTPGRDAGASNESAGDDQATTSFRRQDDGQYGPPTVVQRAVPDDAERPAERPAEQAERPAEQAERPARQPEPQATQAFPRPPDDEELGHHPAVDD